MASRSFPPWREYATGALTAAVQNVKLHPPVLYTYGS